MSLLHDSYLGLSLGEQKINTLARWEERTDRMRRRKTCILIYLTDLGMNKVLGIPGHVLFLRQAH